MAEETMDIPVELQFRDVRKQNKVIIGKNQRQVLPQNGTSFTATPTGQQQIIFRLPNDENSSIDMSSMWICANLQITNLDTTAFTTTTAAELNAPNPLGGAASSGFPILALADSVESIIARVAVYINGSELERQDYMDITESLFNHHVNNSNFSNSVGSGAMLMNLDVVERSKLFLVGAPLTASVATSASNILQVGFPLRWLGIANCRSLIPSYLMGGGQSSIEIRIYLNPSINCIVAGVATRSGTAKGLDTFTIAATEPNLVLSDVRMNVDYVQTSDQYSSALREYLTSNSLTIPLKTYYETTYTISGPNPSGWQNFTVSTQFSDVEAVYIAFFNAGEQNNIAFCGTDRLWKPSGLVQARLSINGQIYPSVPIVIDKSNASGTGSYCAEAYQYLIKALSQNASLEVLGSTNSYVESASTRILVNMSDSAVQTYSSKVGKGFFYAQDRRRYNNSVSGANFVLNGGGNANAFVSPYTCPNHSFVAEPSILFETPTQFALGFDVSKSSYNDDYTLSGSDLSKTSGLIQVQLQFDGSADPFSYNCLVVVQHKRLLEIGMDNASVIY